VEPESLLRVLADGEAHSGEELARRFDVTRAAIWKQTAKLERWGLQIAAVPGVGYRLARKIDLLDVDRLRAGLPERAGWRCGRVEVFTELPSTNRHLLERLPPAHGELDVCIAEFQTAGRGRRGRRWHTPLGAGLCLSAAWQFGETPPDLAALTLAVGVVARRVVAKTCGVGVALKWPNDLVWDDRKLGGVLLDLKAEGQGRCHVVAGIGINVALPDGLGAALSDWPRGAVDLAAATDGSPPPRASLAAALIVALGGLFAAYPRRGFQPYRAEWTGADYLQGRRVTLDDGAGKVHGTALGIEADGALVIQTANGARRRVVSGDVSVRHAR
jgi:BirA family biotin operon repressor/biotin-[acetyl-CoA-carboxylase] ligase